MKIEVGKRYVRRDEVVTGTLRETGRSIYDGELRDPLSGHTYHPKTGRVKGFRTKMDEDIISEYIPTSEAE